MNKAVKALLSSSQVVAAQFKLEVDVSGTGAGAVPIQEDPAGIDHPLCYFSKKFSEPQSYSTIKKKALALLCALHFL